VEVSAAASPTWVGKRAIYTSTNQGVTWSKDGITADWNPGADVAVTNTATSNPQRREWSFQVDDGVNIFLFGGEGMGNTNGLPGTAPANAYRASYCNLYWTTFSDPTTWIRRPNVPFGMRRRPMVAVSQEKTHFYVMGGMFVSPSTAVPDANCIATGIGSEA